MAHDVLFTSTRVPQEVLNATAYFQGTVSAVCEELVDKTCLVVYKAIQRWEGRE